MSDVLFRFDVDAAAEAVLDAVKTGDGIKGFWTSRADVPEQVGETLKLGFAIAPAPFDLRLERSDERTVIWRTESFPPHWVGTTVRWDVEPRDGGSTVRFRHAAFAGAGEAARVADTWGQSIVWPKESAETGRSNPVFS